MRTWIFISEIYMNEQKNISWQTREIYSDGTNSPKMMMSKTRPIRPIIIIIFMLAHHCFLFNFPACCSNWEAPCWSASARWSNSDSFWSLSSTFSTFTRIIPTTSSTCCWVCLSRLFWGLLVLLPGLYFFKEEKVKIFVCIMRLIFIMMEKICKLIYLN